MSVKSLFATLYLTTIFLFKRLMWRVPNSGACRVHNPGKFANFAYRFNPSDNEFSIIYGYPRVDIGIGYGTDVFNMLPYSLLSGHKS